MVNSVCLCTCERPFVCLCVCLSLYCASVSVCLLSVCLSVYLASGGGFTSDGERVVVFRLHTFMADGGCQVIRTLPPVWGKVVASVSFVVCASRRELEGHAAERARHGGVGKSWYNRLWLESPVHADHSGSIVYIRRLDKRGEKMLGRACRRLDKGGEKVLDGARLDEMKRKMWKGT